MTDRTCSVDGCEGRVKALGYCEGHRRRLKLYGDPEGSFPFSRFSDPIIAAAERHLARCTESDTGCWECPNGDRAGYGRVGVKTATGWKSQLAHRVVYEALRAEIPDGLHTDHLCRNPSCCNPWHLEPVTNRVNVLRGTAPTALNALKTECPKGHPYSEENTYRQPNGGRRCRECHRQESRARYKGAK